MLRSEPLVLWSHLSKPRAQKTSAHQRMAEGGDAQSIKAEPEPEPEPPEPPEPEPEPEQDRGRLVLTGCRPTAP